MKLLRHYTTPSIVVIVLALVWISDFVSFGQRSTNQPSANTYSMSIDSPRKPQLRYFLAQLKGDHGVSIIDLDGNIITHNFTPVINSQGKIYKYDCTTPVIDDVFCITRRKETDGRVNTTNTIYKNVSNPTPIPGLDNLYSANIFNPDLFPICRRGERIKFVDKTGKEKFTVMPIDGKEPHYASPSIRFGLIIVEVCYDVKTKEENINGKKVRRIIQETRKEGAIDTNGKWVIYPEWDYLDPNIYSDVLIGRKDGKSFLLDKSGKKLRELEPNEDYDYCQFPMYKFERVRDADKYILNVYLNQKYLTSIDNAWYPRQSKLNPNILLIRNSDSMYYYLIDLNNNTTISKQYQYMKELPDGNYLGEDENKRWLVKPDGTASTLPDNCYYPHKKPLLTLFFDYHIPSFIVENPNGNYICDYFGNKVGDLLIEEFYTLDWKLRHVRSSYCRQHIYGIDD